MYQAILAANVTLIAVLFCTSCEKTLSIFHYFSNGSKIETRDTSNSKLNESTNLATSKSNQDMDIFTLFTGRYSNMVERF